MKGVMRMGLTHENALKEILKLYNNCFDANSLCDRISYVISVEKNLIKFGNWFHHTIAHAFTGDGFADGIEAFGELRGDVFFRDALPKHSENYAKISDALYAATMKCGELEAQCVKAIHACIDTGNESFEDFLRDVNVKQIAPMMHQLVVMYQAVKEYEDEGSIAKWNKDFESYIIPEFKGGEDK